MWAINWSLMLVTLGITVGFGKSDNLTSAYGIAVSATMLMTSVLLFIAMREIWGWSLVTAGAIPDVFMLVHAGSSKRDLSPGVYQGLDSRCEIPFLREPARRLGGVPGRRLLQRPDSPEARRMLTAR